MIAAVAVLSVLAALAVVKTFEQRIPPVAVPDRAAGVRAGPAGRAGVCDVGALAAGAAADRPAAAGRIRGHHRARHVARLPPAADPPQLPDDAMDHRRWRWRPGPWRCPAGRSTGRRATSSTMPTPTAKAIRTARSTACCTPTSAGCSGSAPAKRERYCRRLMRRSRVMLIERTALVWLALGLAVPALIDGWRGLLWGGIVRMAIHNHAMFARQLDLPRVRLAAVRNRRRKPQQPPDRGAGVRRGLAQQPPRLPGHGLPRHGQPAGRDRPRDPGAGTRRAGVGRPQAGPCSGGQAANTRAHGAGDPVQARGGR